MAAKDEVGRYGEDVAERYLRELGWKVLARNWRCREGELDLIAVDYDVLVAVEVKSRRSTNLGLPQEAVTSAKLARVRRLTGAWLAAQDRSWPGVRIDVIGVLLPEAGAARIEHLRGVA